MDGIIIINKPKNCTSHDIVQKAKKIFCEKVGHTGTLDPMATGVLPLLIGKGTQCSQYLVNHDKIYEVQLQLGIKTDTADREGKMIEQKEVVEEILTKENIEKVLQTFLGRQMQVPPIYSAIKVKGKKLYEYARRGESVEIQPRTIEIYKIELLNILRQQKQIEFQVHCSKGTYIRSLCEDIAQKMGTVGAMSELKRIKVGSFPITEAVEMEELEEKIECKEWLAQHFITIERVFQENPILQLDRKQLELFLNGVRLRKNMENNLYRIYHEQKFIGIGVIENQFLKRDIVL